MSFKFVTNASLLTSSGLPSLTSLTSSTYDAVTKIGLTPPYPEEKQPAMSKAVKAAPNGLHVKHWNTNLKVKAYATL